MHCPNCENLNIVQKGFTLAELLLVIAILGLLASIVLVSTSGATERARIAKILQWSQSLHSLLGADVVGLWRLDENPAIHNTIITDSSGKGNNGTLITNDGSNKAVTGIVGGALSFDGVDDYLTVPDANSLDISDNITIEMWVKFAQFEQYGGLVEKGINYRFWQYTADGRIDARFRGTNGVDYRWVTSPGGMSSNTWYHIVFTSRTGDTVRGYINGVQNGAQEEGVRNVSLLTNTSNLVLGFFSGNKYHNGLIDEVRIYNQALTATQIQKHYVEGLNKLLANDAIPKEEYNSRIAGL